MNDAKLPFGGIEPADFSDFQLYFKCKKIL